MVESRNSVFVTNAMEIMSGLNMVKEPAVEFSGNKLITVKKGVKMPPMASLSKDAGVYCVGLKSVNDTFMMDERPSVADILIVAEDAIMFIGNNERAFILANNLMAGRFGICGFCVENDSTRARAFWTVQKFDHDFAVDILKKIKNILSNNDDAPVEPATEEPAAPDPEEEADEEDPWPHRRPRVDRQNA
ncbi:hypothetical protein IJM16_02995 [Candidatus Saccharibacteria bacterium]|nr:hypothetical protein [Candidatus Saccharibacteria bacterium]